MNRTLYPLCALLAWIVVAIGLRRWPTVRQDSIRLATWVMFVFYALIFTAGWSALWGRLDGWSGLPESSTLITQCCVVCFSGAVLTLLALWSYEPAQARVRIRVTSAAVVTVLAVMIVLFLHGAAVHHRESSFTGWYGSTEYDIYLVVYLTVYSAAMGEITRLCWRYTRWVTPSWLRTGLSITGAGAVVGMIYSLSRYIDIIAAHLGLDLDAFENVAEVGAGLGALLVMAGMTAPIWGPRASALAAWRRRLRAYLLLRPLWTAFYTRDPGIAFEIPRVGARRWWHVARHPRELDYRIGRRVVEIRDGILDIRPYLDPQTAIHAREHHQRRGLNEDELAAAVEADHIHAALEASTHRPPFSDAAPLPPVEMNLTPADLDTEIAWLVKVARAFTDTSHRTPAPQNTNPRTVGER